jgi:hypothetical protein
MRAKPVKGIVVMEVKSELLYCQSKNHLIKIIKVWVKLLNESVLTIKVYRFDQR